MKDERKQIECLQLLNQLLPNENAILLCNLLDLLSKVASLHDSNKMTSENLSLIFTPHLFIPKKVINFVFPHDSSATVCSRRVRLASINLSLINHPFIDYLIYR